MIINSSNISHVNSTIASQINSQYANKLAQSDSINKALTELQVKNMDIYSSLSAAPENQVMTGITAMTDIYRAFEHSFSSVLEPITKQAEKDKKAILEDTALSQTQKDEKIAELTKNYASDVKKAASDLSTVYNGMLGGMTQLYSAGGMLGAVTKAFGKRNLSDFSLSLEDLELQNVEKEIQMDDVKASIEKARKTIKMQQQELIDIGKDYGKSVVSNSYVSDTKPSVESLMKAQSNLFSKMMGSLLYSSMASPYKTLNNSISTMFNLSSQFSQYNILV